MTTQWGAPLTGAQMNLLRAAGLPDGTAHQFQGTRTGQWHDGESIIHSEFPGKGYRLPINHLAYALLEKGWLDGRNVRLWFGGDKAPDDRLAAGEVLLRGGRTIICVLRWANSGSPEDVIAYIAKAESAYPPDGGSKDQVREPSECQSAFQTIADTVTIAKDDVRHLNFTGECHADAARFVIEDCTLISREGETWINDMCRAQPFTLRGYRIEPIEADTVTLNTMTEAEWLQKDFIKDGDFTALEILHILGLIKPEPARAERFTAKVECSHVGNIVELPGFEGFQCSACGKVAGRREVDLARFGVSRSRAPRMEATTEAIDPSRVPPSNPSVESFLHRSGWEGNRDVELALQLFVEDYATIAKTTQAELNRKVASKEWMNAHSPHAYMQAYHDLGLIKPEPTRAERFTAATGIAVTPEILRALEFEQ